MVRNLLNDGHDVTIATRGMTEDEYGDKVSRIKIDIYDKASVEAALSGKKYDVVIDKIGYGASDVNNVLSNVECEKFIHMSTAGVYRLDHYLISEEEFDPRAINIRWGTRGDFEYDELKKMAEAVLAQKYDYLEWSVVRSPYVLGRDDYTNRLFFYVEKIINGYEIKIDNLDSSISVANGDELGNFMAKLAIKKAIGEVNSCAEGTIKIRDIIEYIESKSGKIARISEDGINAPYNGMGSYSLCLDKARENNYLFSNVDEWIYDLLDYYLWKAKTQR